MLGQPICVFPYFTNGGITYDDPNNTMVELFAQVSDKLGRDLQIRPYISTQKKNVTVACYLGKQCQIDKSKRVAPFQWQLKDEPKEVRYCDYEKVLVNKDERATLKILQQVEFSYLTNQTFRSGYSNQRSVVIFVAKTDISKRKDPLLEVFNDEAIPEVSDFLSLGLPIRQVVKVDRNSNSKETAATFKAKGSQGMINWSQYDQFEIDTYPKMESISASAQIDQLVQKMAGKKKPDEEQDQEDFGCIFEIDLTQGKKVAKVLNDLQIRHIQKLRDKKRPSKTEITDLKVESLES